MKIRRTFVFILLYSILICSIFANSNAIANDPANEGIEKAATPTPSLVSAEETENKKVDFKKLNILSKFNNRSAAENLVYSLNKSGQEVRIVTKEIDISLKSLSIGLFLTRMRAEHVVKRLKKHNIDAFVFELKSGKFRVYAGAMKDESNFWERYEKLLTLGYKKPHTSIKIAHETQYFVVSDKEDESKTITKAIAKLRPIEAKNSQFITEMYSARFKGEFSMWGEEGNRSSSNYFNSSINLRTKYKANLDFTYGTRFQATEQSSEENIQKFEFDLQPTYLRYQQQQNEWSIGAIDARWDAINPNKQHESLSDRLSGKVLVRYKLDTDKEDNRRPSFGMRWKFDSAKTYDLDVIWLPVFRPAKLPDFGSVWHPVRRSDGAIRGIKPTKNWAELVKRGSFADDKLGTGGAGVRFSNKVGSRTRAITLQYTRRSEPYYALNPLIADALNAGKTLNFALAQKGYTFTPKHPYSGIMTWEESSKVSHFEFAVLSNTPYTTTDYRYKTAMSMAWKLGFIYPKTSKKSLVSAYLTGRHINTKDKILDRKTKISLFGELYSISHSGTWKFSSTYEIGLDRLALFLNPRLTFQQTKYVQIYVNYLLFSGDKITESGYQTKNSILSLTWQAGF